MSLEFFQMILHVKSLFKAVNGSPCVLYIIRHLENKKGVSATLWSGRYTLLYPGDDITRQSARSES